MGKADARRTKAQLIEELEALRENLAQARQDEAITRLRRTEEALRTSEERNRLLLAHLTSGFALHEIILGEDGQPVDYRFLDVNPAFEELTGLKREDVVGRTVMDILPAITSVR